MEGTIGTLIIVILMIVAHIIKAIKESAVAKQQQPDGDEEELVIISRPKPVKLPLGNKQRSHVRHSVGETLESSSPKKRQALSKKLSPQGEGQRFETAPGTLEAARIVAPTIDPSMKPELESITGIYEEGAVFAERSKPAITLNIADFLAKPEGIVQAVILAEIFNRPAWQETPRECS
jgi:hypothetical protein